MQFRCSMIRHIVVIHFRVGGEIFRFARGIHLSFLIFYNISVVLMKISVNRGYIFHNGKFLFDFQTKVMYGHYTDKLLFVCYNNRTSNVILPENY